MPFLRVPPYDFRWFWPLFQKFQIPQIWPDLTELDPIRLNLNNFDQNLTKSDSAYLVSNHEMNQLEI